MFTFSEKVCKRSGHALLYTRQSVFDQFIQKVLYKCFIFYKTGKKLLKIRGNIFKAGGGNNVDVTVTYLVDSC